MKKKFLSMLAFIMALSMMAAGCSDSKDPATADGSETSIKVINNNAETDLDGNTGVTSATSAAVTEEMVTLTDADGNVVTGIDGNAITVPAVTTAVNTETMSDEEIEAAMTSQTTEANLIITRTDTERYGYSTLTAEEKKLYDDIVHGIEGLKYKICEEDA
ncbi:MAG: hypothetical protein K2J76_00825, partial [Oscillospiraceae bacterium]|nr:hypothetical protein [Oscillospiraceae bacterium]